jgi:uncharacterized protein (DUF58 family)
MLTQLLPSRWIPGTWQIARLWRGDGPQREVELTRSRIYLLPTRNGLMFGVVLFVMLMGGLNYANSLALAFAFVLAGLGWVSIHHTYLNLRGLRIRAAATAPVFAGQASRYRITLENPTPQPRFAIHLRQGESHVYIAQLDPGLHTVELPIKHARRGEWHAGRINIETRYPLELIRGWGYAELSDLKSMVYPQPAAAREPQTTAGGESGSELSDRRGNDDFLGLRQFDPSDPLRLVHWKVSARTGELVSKQFGTERSSAVWLEWAQTVGDTEARLSTLTREIVEAHRAGLKWGLMLPAVTFDLDSGDTHLHSCLRALALFEL